MNKKSPPVPGPEFTSKDTDRLIANYGQSISPEKKTTLLAKLEKERGAFTKANSKDASAPPARGKERG